MSRPSTTRHQQVAHAIIHQAGELFDARGYGNTSLQDIADAVGVARPSLYHYFPSKEHILVTIVERSIDVRDEIISRVRSMTAPPRRRLEVLLTDLGMSTSSNPAGLRLVLNAAAALPDDTRRRDVRSRRAMFEFLSELIGEGIDAGAFRPDDERSTAATVIAALTGLQYTAIGGVSLTPNEATERMVAMLLGGICRSPADGPSDLDEALAVLYEDLQTLERHARSMGNRARTQPRSH